MTHAWPKSRRDQHLGCPQVMARPASWLTLSQGATSTMVSPKSRRGQHRGCPQVKARPAPWFPPSQGATSTMVAGLNPIKGCQVNIFNPIHNKRAHHLSQGVRQCPADLRDTRSIDSTPYEPLEPRCASVPCWVRAQDRLKGY